MCRAVPCLAAEEEEGVIQRFEERRVICMHGRGAPVEILVLEIYTCGHSLLHGGFIRGTKGVVCACVRVALKMDE